MATQQESIEDFRIHNEAVITAVRKALDLIRDAHGKDESRNGLYNIGIVYNNKMMELTRIQNQSGVDFFGDDTVCQIVRDHLSNILVRALGYLDKYVEVNVSTYYDDFAILKSDNRKELRYYRELTNVISDFDMKQQLPDIIAGYFQNKLISPVFCMAFYVEYDDLKQELIDSLRRIGYEDIIDNCISEYEYAFQLMKELFEENGIDIEALLAADDEPSLA